MKKQDRKFTIVDTFKVKDVEQKLMNVVVNDMPLSLEQYMALEIEDIMKRFSKQYPNEDIKDVKFEYIMKDKDYILAGEIYIK